MTVGVKICGLTRRADAEVAVDAGADHLGVVLVAESPRAVPPGEAGSIRAGSDARLFLVTADRPVGELAAIARAASADGVQLHGSESLGDVRTLRGEGSWTIWKSVRVREAADLDRAVDRFGDDVDGIHLDGWDPRRIGGTGVRFSWDEVGRIRDSIPPGLTLVVSGGLTPESVAEAVQILRPDIVDVSSGVESSPGIKDPDMVRAFVRNAKRPRT